MRFQQWGVSETRPYTSAAPALPRLTWPDAVAYQEAIQTPSLSLADPQFVRAQVTLDKRSLPVAYAGRFAVVFKLKTDSGETWALRCFTTPGDDHGATRAARYKIIQQYVDAHRNIFVPFRYLERGIKVGPNWYPALAMRWAEGVPLGRWVENNRHNPDALRKLCGQLTALLMRLEGAGLAHGDWQHDNLLIADEGRRITLVDYDGMFVPEFAGQTSPELGHPNYQHPARTADHFGPGLDRFSCLVIQTALLAIARNPDLWDNYSDGESLLFKKADFLNPSDSPVFAELRALAELDRDGLLADAIARLEDACRVGAMHALPAEVAPDSELVGSTYEPIHGVSGSYLSSLSESIEAQETISPIAGSGKQWWMLPEVVNKQSGQKGRVAPVRSVTMAVPDTFTYMTRVISDETRVQEDKHFISWRVGIGIFLAVTLSLAFAQHSAMRFFLVGPFLALLINLGSLGYNRWPRKIIYDELIAEIAKMENLIAERREKIAQKGGYNANNAAPIKNAATVGDYIAAKLRQTSINQVMTVVGIKVQTLRYLKQAGIENAFDLQQRSGVPSIPSHQWTAVQNWCKELEQEAAAEYRRNRGNGNNGVSPEVVRLRHEVAEFERHVAQLKRERDSFPEVAFTTYCRRLFGMDTSAASPTAGKHP